MTKDRHTDGCMHVHHFTYTPKILREKHGALGFTIRSCTSALLPRGCVAGQEARPKVIFSEKEELPRHKLCEDRAFVSSCVPPGTLVID